MWDAEFVSILPIYFADGVQQATKLVNKKGIKIRVITEIKKDNLETVIQMAKLYDVRHQDGIKGNFGILDRRHYIVVHTTSHLNKVFLVIQKLLEQQQYIFDTLWESAISSRLKIRQIELANEPEFIKDDLSMRETNRVLNELIDCSTKEILMLLPRPESVNHLREHGILDSFLLSPTHYHPGVVTVI